MSAPMTPPKSDAPTKPGISARNPNLIVGAAVHHDLYEVGGDPEAEAKVLRGQARTLGLAFFVFFSLILSGISFSLNSFWTPFVAHTTVAEGAEPGPGLIKTDDGFALSEPTHAAIVWSPEATSPARIDRAEDEQDDIAPTPGSTRVDLVVNRRTVAKLYGDAKPDAHVHEVSLAGAQLYALPGRSYAWQQAKLARTVPTRFVTLAGAVFGVFALLMPGMLVPFYTFWMRFVTAPLGFVNTRIILGLVWFGMFTPLAIWFAIRRVFLPQADSLRRAPKEPSETYWVERKKRDGKHYEQLF